MEKIGLGSRQVAKFLQLVALVLIAAVLGGSQCVDSCSVLGLKTQPKTCHQNQSPSDSSPSNNEACSHRELVAEKRSNVSSADDLQVVSFAAFRIGAYSVPLRPSSPLTLSDRHFSGFSPLALTSILRI